MNFWQEKKQFWKNKTGDNEIYARQRREVARDVVSILTEKGLKTILDVGGYDGSLGTYLPALYKKEYKSIDILEGFDITESWAKQKLTPEKYDIVVCNLILLCISPDKTEHVLDEVFKRARYAVYIFEEYNEGKKHGDWINDDYGGKWVVTLPGIIRNRVPLTCISQDYSKVNRSWAKYTIIK